MPTNARTTTLFEDRDILSYFQQSHLAKIRYSCVRAKELDDQLGGGQNSDYFLAAQKLADAIRQELGLPLEVPEGTEATASVTAFVEPTPQLKNGMVEPLFTRLELIKELGFPVSAEELNDDLSKKKIVAVLSNEDNSDVIEDLGITQKIMDSKKADLIKFIYTGE